MALRVRGETVEEITGAVTAMRAKMLRVKAPAERNRHRRHRRRRIGLAQRLDARGDHRRRLRRSRRQARQPRSLVEVGRRGRAGGARRQGRTDPRGRRALHRRGRHRLHDGADASRGDAPCRHRRGSNSAPAPSSTCSARSPTRPGVKRQLIGVFSSAWLRPMAEVLRNLGSERVWVTHGGDGLDEITTTGATSVVELERRRDPRFRVTPEDVGLPRAEPRRAQGRRPRLQRGGAARACWRASARLSRHRGIQRRRRRSSSPAPPTASPRAWKRRARRSTAARRGSPWNGLSPSQMHDRLAP